MRGRFLVAILAVLITFMGCIMPTTNVAIAPGASLASIKKVAVWRFRDGGRVSNSGDVATRAMEAEFLRRGIRIIPFGQIREIIAVEIGSREGIAIEAGMLTPRVLQRIREETGADTLVIGSVSDAWCDVRWAPPCWIEVQFQIVNSDTGDLLASGSVSDEGWSLQGAAAQMAQKAVGKLQ